MTKSDIKEFIQSIIITGVLTFLIITFVGQSMIVDGSSMEPNLHNGARLFINKFIYNFKSPERYDVIVFRPKHKPEVRFIKRVIGLPGETIIIRDGKTYIDGKPLEEDYIKEPMVENYGPFVIPKNHLFVMGDNRNSSLDSRYTYVGYINYKSIVGEAFWVYWPLKNMRKVD
jgi:signal peptidase I